MNTKTIVQSLLFVAVISIANVSCKKEDDPEPAPSGGSTQSDYVGNWKCTETSSKNGVTIFNMVIAQSTVDNNQMLFGNIYGLGTSIKATAVISGVNFTFPLQVLSGNQLESGGGVLSGNTINMTYIMYDGLSNDSCSATLTRQ